MSKKDPNVKVYKMKRDFTQVPNPILRTPKLNFKLKGLLSYLLSKDADYDFSYERIILETEDKRDSILAGLKELEKKGYLKRERLYTGRVKYHIYEIPRKKEKATSGKAPLGKMPTISNTESNNNTDYRKNKQKRINLFKKLLPESYTSNKTFMSNWQLFVEARVVDHKKWNERCCKGIIKKLQESKLNAKGASKVLLESVSNEWKSIFPENLDKEDHSLFLTYEQRQPKAVAGKRRRVK